MQQPKRAQVSDGKVTLEVAAADVAYLKGLGWSRVDEPEPFDPGEFSVDDVNSYLSTATPEEQGRVLALEVEGKARKGIIGDSVI